MSGQTPLRDPYQSVEIILGEIISEMKRIGYWSEAPLPDEAFQFTQAFAMDTMTFPQWLQHILIPRVNSILDEKGDFPDKSMVGTQAIREIDGDETASTLVHLLNEFDRIINQV